MDAEKDLELEHREVAADDDQRERERKLVRKIDLWLMPSIWLIYLFSYVDRTAIGLAKVGGMAADIQLTDQQYFLTVAVFQVGYVIAEIPSNMILSVSRPSLYIPAIMILWGAVSASLAAVQTPAQLIAVRFVLGIFEAGFSPAVLFLISTWYKKSEQSKRFITFLSAGVVSGAFGSIVSGAISSSIDGNLGIRGWRWLFIVEGVATCGVAFAAPFFLLDYPATSAKLTPEERELAVRRLRADGMTINGSEDRLGHMQSLRKALDWRTLVLALAYMTIISALSLSYFYPTLVAGLGYTSTTAQFMTAPLFVVALVIAIPTCYLADGMRPATRAFLVAGMLAAGALFCALSAGVTALVPRYVFLCFINSAIWTANPLALSYASACLAGSDPETRSIALAVINGAGNLAQLYGSAVFPDSDAPLFTMGFSVYAASMFAGVLLYAGSYWLFKRFPFKGAYAQAARAD